MLDVEKYLQLTGHRGAVYSITRAENPDSVFTAGSDGFIARWNIFSGQSGGALAQIQAPVFCLYHHRESRTVWAGREDGGLHVIDLANKSERKLLKNHTGGVFSIYEAHGLVYTSGGNGTIAVISPETFETLKIRKISSEKLRGIYAHPVTGHLFLASADGKIREFDKDLNGLIREWPAHEGAANAVSFLPDGRLISGGRDARLKIWDIGPVEPQLTENIPAHNYAVYKIKVVESQNVLITCSRDKTLKIWNLDSLQVLKRISRKTSGGHKNSVNSFEYFPESRKLVSVSDDSTVMVWELSGLMQNKTPGHQFKLKH
jgi:WD40 repeat protein